MANKTGISWTDATINPIVGCTPVSPGCANCYAAVMAHRFGGRIEIYEGLTTEQGKWTGDIHFNPVVLQKKMPKDGRLNFLCSMADPFHEKVQDEWLDQIFEFTYQNPQHIFQVLTKRPERMVEYFSQHDLHENLWLGVTAENQETAAERIPQLLRLDPRVAFVSAEPLLGSIDFSKIPNAKLLNWVIVGGETGRNARPMQPEWAVEIRDWCFAEDIPFFFKQMGGKGKRIDQLEGSFYQNYPCYALSQFNVGMFES